MPITNNRIDAYIQKDSDDYCMYFTYNDIDFSSIYKDSYTKDFAIDFSKIYLKTSSKFNNHNFTDDHGKTVLSIRTEDNILSSIKGIKEIDNALVRLIVASVHPAINSDLTIHLQNKKYELIKDEDRINHYKADILKSDSKGLSVDELHNIAKDLNSIKENEPIQYQKKTNIYY